MSAIWHDSGRPSWLGVAPSFSFHELPEAHQEAPTPYAAAMEMVRARDMLLGAGWLRHNAKLSHAFWVAKRPWWL